MSTSGLFLAAAAIGLLHATVLSAGAQERSGLRPPVHPRRNVEEFAPIEAKFIRFTIELTNGGQPCLDELEVYGPGDPSRNLALAEHGTEARASGTLPEYRIHALRHVNDGVYGNGHSWICDVPRGGWVELELPAVKPIDRVIWGRDREGKFTDRLATDYRIEVAREPGQWKTVASSADRAPLVGGWPLRPGVRTVADGLPPAATTLTAPSRPAMQEYTLEKWQIPEGLPSDTVTAIIQGRDGWLWIGTTNGLARFDGVRFVTFGESEGLPDLTVTCLLEDRSGALWVGTAGGGLAQWEDGRFTVFRLGNGRPDNTVLALGEQPNGTLWVGTSVGLLEETAGGFVRRASGAVSRLVADADGVWLLSNAQLRRWRGELLDEPSRDLEPSRFSTLGALAAGRDGALWFGGANAYVGRLKEGVVQTFGEGHPALVSSLWEILPLENGDVWIGTSASGLVRLRGGSLLSITTEDGLPANSVRALCADREGNTWVGMAGGGLACLRPRMVRAITTGDGLSHNGVITLAEDATGTVWIGTNGGGLNRWDGKKVAPYAPSFALENTVISALAPARDGALYLACSGEALFRIRGDNMERFDTAHGLPGRNISALAEDAAGGLWIGTTDGGPAYFHHDRITRPESVKALAGQAITSLAIETDGTLWLGSSGNGVSRLRGGKLTQWTREHGLASAFIRTLRLDARGTVWAGTSQGVTRWRDGVPESFTMAHGLPAGGVSQILDDTSGHLWLGTSRGVFRVPHRSFEDVSAGRAASLDMLRLGLEDGLPSLECTGGTHPAGLRRKDGRLCFGTTGGLAILNPGDFAQPSAAPPVVIEGISMNGGTWKQADMVEIPPGTGRVDLRFTALAYRAPQRVKFRYRMDGSDANWTEIGDARSVTFPRLQPGTYRFHVTANQDGGPWSATGAVTTLRVLAPWWRNPWMLAAGAVAGMAGVAATARYVTRRRMHRRMELLEQQYALERERSRIARDIHDDLGANLTQITLLSTLGKERSDQPVVVQEQFAAIAATAGELVQAMDAIVWAVNPRHNSVESLARYVTRFAEDLFAPAAVRLRLDVPLELPDCELTSEARHNVFLATKEALNNALRHSGATEVWLRLFARDGRLTIAIEDNGKGFDVASEHDGDGLGNLRRRLAECGGTCEIASASDHGTQVTFSIPLQS